MSYRLLDSGSFRKLEEVGPFRLVRPSPSATWEPEFPAQWKTVDAVFERYSDGDGEWKVKNAKVKDGWQIDLAGLKFNMKLTSFGHLGIFPEQKQNWLRLEEIIRQRLEKSEKTEKVEKSTSKHASKSSASQVASTSASRTASPIASKASDQSSLRVLNLFAYTGGSSLICAKAGASVTHVDASKGSVNWARENAEVSGLANRPIRWLVDDVQEFVEREIRRGNKYQGIILDPPSYGRGPKKQVWKIEDHLTPFLHKLSQLLADDALFVLLSCHSPGYTPTSLENQLRQIFKSRGGRYESSEMLIENPDGLPLPSGCSSLWIGE